MQSWQKYYFKHLHSGIRIKKIAAYIATALFNEGYDRNNYNISRSAIRQGHNYICTVKNRRSNSKKHPGSSSLVHWNGKLGLELEWSWYSTIDKRPKNWITIQKRIKIRFFDNAVPIESKRKMEVTLKNRERALEPSKRFLAHYAIPQEMTTRSLDEFVTCFMLGTAWRV